MDKKEPKKLTKRVTLLISNKEIDKWIKDINKSIKNGKA